MSKKLVITTISMQSPDKLKCNPYRKGADGVFLSEAVHFPVLAMMEWNILPGEEVELVTVRRENDDNTEVNYQTFLTELREMQQRSGISCRIVKEITVPHTEDKAKQTALFRELCAVYPEGADVYMDLSFGTKITTVCLFSTLPYAEKARGCTIKHITYGLHNYNASPDEEPVSQLYNVRYLYDMASFIHTVDMANADDIDHVIEGLWG